MARSHARIAVTIWQDDDFLALRPGPQRLYLFLVSQPNLTHLGVLPLTLRRWVRTADAYTLDDLGDDLDALEEAGFVVVDEDAEELLVRSYMRNDGVYKQPNVLTSAVASVGAVHSGQVKRALLAEVARIDLTSLSDEGGDKSKRAVAAGLLEQLREGIGEPLPEPHLKGSRNPSANPSLGVPGTPYAGASAQPLSLSPTTTPSPTVPPPAGAVALPGNGTVVAAFIEGAHDAGMDRPGRSIIARVGKAAKQLLADGANERDVLDAARRLGAGGWDDLEREVRRLQAERRGTTTKPSTTDAKVANTLALAERFREQDAS